MSLRVVLLRLTVLLVAVVLSGCVTTPAARLTQQSGESMVFVGEEPSLLAFPPAPGAPLRLRSTYLPGAAERGQAVARCNGGRVSRPNEAIKFKVYSRLG